MTAVNNIFKETLAQYLAILRAFYDAVEKNVNCTLRDFIYGIRPLLILTTNVLSQVVGGATIFAVCTGSLAQLSYLIGIYIPLPGGSVSAVFDAPFWFFNVTEGFWGVFGDIIFGFHFLMLSSVLVYIIVAKSCDLGKVAQNKTGDPVNRYYLKAIMIALLISLFIVFGVTISAPRRAGESLESNLSNIYLQEFKSLGIESFSFVQKDNNKGELVIRINGSTHTWEGDTSSFEYSYGLSNDHDEYDGPYYVTEKFQGRYRFDMSVNNGKGEDAFIASGNGFLRDYDKGSPDLDVKLERANWMIKSASSLAKGLSNEEGELMAEGNG